MKYYISNGGLNRADEFVKIFEEHGFKIERLENAGDLDVLVNIESTEK